MNPFFSRLFGKKDTASGMEQATKNELLVPVQVAPGLVLPKVLADHFDQISPTARQTVLIRATPLDKLSLRESKFGHYPCVPKDFQYPRDRDGNLMFPLAQINFGEVPHLERFPTSGYLQFYVASDDTYGLSFEKDVPSDFTVVFFEEAEVTDPLEELSFLDEVIASDNGVIYKPHGLTFELKTEYVGMGDVKGGSAAGFDMDAIIAQHPNMRREIEDAVFMNFSPTGHKLGGYAYFTQWDPRDEEGDKRDYMLLFQMDSDDHIMWGDVGVGNFFIDPTDLAKRDFSRVLYTWDCH
jgi:uncharacterized protein YwqG